MSSNPDDRKLPTIKFVGNGPILVQSLDTMTDHDGKELPTKRSISLCRCGQSRNKPFCDGRHKAAGFSDEKSTDGEWDKRVDYDGRDITVHDNRGICSHAAFCTKNLAAVWRSDKEPWIDPDGAPAEETVNVIRTCPSGALSYTIDGVEHQGHGREPAVRLTEDGPYAVEGGIEIEGVEQGEGASTEHFALCRCGASKNKPFCGGAHWYAHFKGDNSVKIADLGELDAGKPVPREVDGVELVLVRFGDDVSVHKGICRHQGGIMSDGDVAGDDLICGLHGWAYNIRTGVNEDGSGQDLKLFKSWVERDHVFVDADEIVAWKKARAVAPKSESAAPDSEATPEEPHNAYIHHLAQYGLSKTGSHGRTTSMGVPRYELPSWDDLQFITAQLHKFPQLDDVAVGTELVIGAKAAKPLRLDIPLFVSDMSFGSLSFEAKTALAMGAEMAGTGICSGEGGMLPEEQQANSRYFYELASARFGFALDLLTKVQAFHFKGGQVAKTGTGGHLPGEKVSRKIAEVRGLEEGQPAISPARFPDWDTVDDFRKFADQVREKTGGIPIGFKLSAQHIEEDIDAAIQVGVDYIILDGRGGGTGAAPAIFRDNISVPTLPAIARARKHLDQNGNGEITLVATGGLRTPADFAKALALGADGVAISNSAIQAIGCIGTRACNTNNCPVGIATQKESLRARLIPGEAAERLNRFLRAATDLMFVMARACGHTHLNQFTTGDLTTWKRDVAYLTGVKYGGVVPL
jgi:glutamate synthase domain-containing protein 2/CDGSH-type Zn-finger protein